MKLQSEQQFDPEIHAASDPALRIALAVNLIPSKFGSLEQWILWFVREARALGHSVDLICRGEPISEIKEALENLGAKIILIDQLCATPLQSIKLLASYNIIHLNLFGLRERFPLLSYLASPAQVLFSDHLSRTSQTKRNGFITRILDRISSTRIHSFATVSDFIAKELAQRLPSRSDDIRPIYNGVDTERFSPKPKRVGPLRIVTTAHLIPEKGIDLLVRAFDRFTDKESTLTIIGSGPEEPRLRALVHSLWLDQRVSFLGTINNVEEILASADIFVHPARWHEAFGLGVAEAMACGVPVVAPDSGAMPELIQDGVSGLLVQPDSVTAICEALERLKDSEILRRKLSKNARQEVLNRFSLEQSVTEHINWCEEVAYERISSSKA